MKMLLSVVYSWLGTQLLRASNSFLFWFLFPDSICNRFIIITNRFIMHLFGGGHCAIYSISVCQFDRTLSVLLPTASIWAAVINNSESLEIHSSTQKIRNCFVWFCLTSRLVESEANALPSTCFSPWFLRRTREQWSEFVWMSSLFSLSATKCFLLRSKANSRNFLARGLYNSWFWWSAEDFSD